MINLDCSHRASNANLSRIIAPILGALLLLAVLVSFLIYRSRRRSSAFNNLEGEGNAPAGQGGAITSLSRSSSFASGVPSDTSDSQIAAWRTRNGAGAGATQMSQVSGPNAAAGTGVVHGRSLLDVSSGEFGSTPFLSPALIPSVSPFPTSDLMVPRSRSITPPEQGLLSPIALSEGVRMPMALVHAYEPPSRRVVPSTPISSRSHFSAYSYAPSSSPSPEPEQETVRNEGQDLDVIVNPFDDAYSPGPNPDIDTEINSVKEGNGSRSSSSSDSHETSTIMGHNIGTLLPAFPSPETGIYPPPSMRRMNSTSKIGGRRDGGPGGGEAELVGILDLDPFVNPPPPVSFLSPTRAEEYDYRYLDENGEAKRVMSGAGENLKKNVVSRLSRASSVVGPQSDESVVCPPFFLFAFFHQERGIDHSVNLNADFDFFLFYSLALLAE